MNKSIETPIAARLSGECPDAPLRLLFAIQDLERENAQLKSALDDAQETIAEYADQTLGDGHD